MHIVRLSILSALALVTPLSSMAAAAVFCSNDEETIFTCNTKRKTYEICASRDLSATSGYMQYRAGTHGKVEFVYPKQRMLPVGKFKLVLLARGAQLSFQNGEFTYEIVEPLVGTSQIWVGKNDKSVSSIECLNHSDSLTLTNTQSRFKALGIYK